MKQEQSVRIQTSVLNGVEKKVLVWLAQRQPRWMTSDMLTAIGVVGALVVAVGYAMGGNATTELASQSKIICRTFRPLEDANCLLVPRSEGDSAELSRRLELLRSQGAEICLGSDLPATGEGPSMLAEMKLLKDVPLAELCKWATINPAKALGIDDEFGRIEVGRKCGLVLLEGIARDPDGVLRVCERTTSRRLA